MIYKRRLAWVACLASLAQALALAQPPLPCPAACSCRHTTVRCTAASRSTLGRLPAATRHLYLSGSALPSLGPGDLAQLPLLTSLSLANTGLATILPGAFAQTPRLERLDLSYNLLQRLDSPTLGSLPRLLVLKVNNNRLTCLSPALASLSHLEVLSLQHNRLARLPRGLASLARLRQLRIDRNRLDCSCAAHWLAAFLRRRPGLGLGALCSAPRGLAGSSVSALLPHTADCSGPPAEEEECSAAPRCPDRCKCARGTVDCRNLGLTSVPGDIPADTKELRLEQNLIEEIPSFAFRTAPGLKRIDLSRNQLRRIAADALTYNKQLTTLILYDNLLPSLAESTLAGLPRLQMILLNKNRLSCLPKNLFKDQAGLVLLSLYDNQLASLPEGIFTPLTALSTLYLGANPWQCSCPLLGLHRLLADRELGGAGAVCTAPTRLKGQALETVKPAEFLCGEAGTVQRAADTCTDGDQCPTGCSCSAGTLDCRGAGLSSLPAPLPRDTHTLLLDRNSLSDPESLARACAALPGLRNLSMRHNSLPGLPPGAALRPCAGLQLLDLSHNRLATLGGPLTGLKGLSTLRLAGNDISCIDESALESLSGLRELELDLRYLHCSCENDWVRDWMVQRRAKVVNYNCPSNGNCSSSTPPSGCNIALPCPEGCSCKGDVVRCSGLGLARAPAALPLLATELHLAHNSITLQLNATLEQSLVRLTLLDLSENRISSLGPSSLPHLPRLTHLALAGNRIQCIAGGAFRRLPRLASLSLERNDLAGLERTVFSSVATLSSLQLDGNPLHCDCRLSWYPAWLAERSLPSPAACSSPAPLAGRSLASLPARALVCTGQPLDPVQARCDACFSEPCRHGGLCTRQPGLAYTCQCPSLYTGERCEHRLDPCLAGPCRNGALCRSRRGEVTCTCTAGWEGARCQTNTDDCLGHACQHGGLCRDGLAGYSCSCAAGWRGRRCEEAAVRPESRPAAVPAACDLCQHGGVCSTAASGPACTCPPGYSGTYCEEAPTVQVAAYQQASPCQAAPCRHGSCLASGPGEFSCRCHPGYSGKRCEYLTTVQLAGHRPFLQLDPLYTNRPLNLTLVLKTTESSGVLLYHGDSDHLAVELFHGRVRVSLNVGNPPASTMFSYAVLNDDRPHAVELLLLGRNLTMRVDGGLARSLINLGSREVLSVASPTFLGGLPEAVGERALAQWHLRNSTSLRGCVTNFYIDDKTIDFLQAAHQRPGVLAGCFQRYLSSSVALADSETGPGWLEPRRDREGGRGRKGRGRVGRQKAGCEDNRCRETGTRGCSPRSGGNYRCRCKRGYAGRYCERAPSCRKKKVKQFLKENGCRSRKLVSQAACQGTCHGAACCKPRKMKKKKVGMICEDGTRYVKTVEVARKCSCGKAKSSTCPATGYRSLLTG